MKTFKLTGIRCIRKNDDFIVLVIIFIIFSTTLRGKDHFTSLPGIKSDSDTIVPIIYPPLTARDGIGLDIPKPPSGHPRLLFQKKDIPLLKEKIKDPLMKECWDKIIQSAAYKTDGKLSQEGGINNQNNIIRNAIEAKALIYAFTGDANMGHEAVNALMNYYSSLKLSYKVFTDLIQQYHANVDIGRTILTGAMVYDWCYDLISSSDKQILINRMETMGADMEIEWPKLRQGSVVGHGSENQLARDMLSCGIATYDEKPIIYKLAAGRIIAEFVPVRKFYYPAGYHHQGSSYGPQRFNNELWATFIFDRMGYPDIFGKEQALVPYFWVYIRRPDGQYLRDGDDSREQRIEFGRYWSNAGDMLAGSYFNDPILMGEAFKQGQLGRDYLFDYLFFNINVPPSDDKSSLPLTRYFKEPGGLMVARTGWEDGISSKAVVAFMKVGVINFANHQHLDAGSFQLYYKAPLAIESGIYQGAMGGYGSEHFKNYMQRTIAHNSMLVYNPDEKFFLGRNEIINDGGQQYPNRGSEPRNLEMLLQNDYKTGEVLAHYFGPDQVKPDVSYLKGELKEAYSDKIKSFKRSFVFLNLKNDEIPAALIIFDRIVSSNGNFKKYWLIHCVEEPVISGNITTIKRNEKGYNGKLINITLFPDPGNLVINKTGGKGNEFNVFGKNFPDAIQDPVRNSADGPAWRIEVSPEKASEEDIFLNVMQVMDYTGGPEKPLEIKKIETEKLLGIEINDRIVLFSKNGELVGETLKLKINGTNNYKVMIADMKEGTWTIRCLTNKKSPLVTLKCDKQVLYFDAKKGDYLISINKN